MSFIQKPDGSFMSPRERYDKSMSRAIRGAVYVPATLLTVLAFGAFINSPIKNERESRGVLESKLKHQVSWFADWQGNRDGNTSEDELIKTYGELGVKYDALNPAPLTVEQMQKYIALHSIKE